MQVAESFISINGEGPLAGELSVFIRFKGCNLNCSYCDTGWANMPSCDCEEKKPEEILAYIGSTGIKNVTLTGGEPLLQKDMRNLLDLIGESKELRCEIETNGSVELSPFCESPRPSFTMDYKLPSSGCEQQMLTSNLLLLGPADTVKFVAGDRSDLERAWEVISQYGLQERCHVYLSPVFGRIDPAEIVEFMKEKQMNDVRLQLQMHKVIWDPEKRGV